jgi:hypothetical protein
MPRRGGVHTQTDHRPRGKTKFRAETAGSARLARRWCLPPPCLPISQSRVAAAHDPAEIYVCDQALRFSCAGLAQPWSRKKSCVYMQRLLQPLFFC